MASGSETIKSLKILLADTYTLYLKTQNYHWNVKGLHFHSLHLLFEKQYEELADAVDEIAERIRACGEYTPGSFVEFINLKTIAEAKSNIDATQMLKDLKESHEKIAQYLPDFSQKMATEQDEASQDLIIQRMAYHDKTIWMLASSLG